MTAWLPWRHGGGPTSHAPETHTCPRPGHAKRWARDPTGPVPVRFQLGRRAAAVVRPRRGPRLVRNAGTGTRANPSDEVGVVGTGSLAGSWSSQGSLLPRRLVVGC